MPNLFDEFDLELQKINMDITTYSDSASDSVVVCSSSGSAIGSTNAPTCFNICA